MSAPALTSMKTQPRAVGSADAHRSQDDTDHWVVAPAWRDRFDLLGQVDWHNLDHEARAQLVKANPNRQVWRVTLGDDALYAKVFQPTGWLECLRALFRKPEALLEWYAGRYADTHAVPCVRPVACTWRRRRSGGATSVLIAEQADGAVPLSDAWRQVRQMVQPHDRRRATAALVHAAAHLLAQAHQSRFLHRDGHVGNILVQDALGSSPAALYADPYGATTHLAIQDDRAARSIAHLDQWFQRQASRGERLRFLRAYLAKRFGQDAVSSDALRRWAALIARATQRQGAALYAKRDGRVWRNNKYFATMTIAGGWRATVALRARHREEFPRPTPPDRAATAWRETLAAHVRRTHTQMDEGDDTTGERWVAGGLWERWSWRWLGSPARRRFAVGHALRHRDIPCVWVPAVLERRAALGVSECHVLSERRPHCHPLGELPAATWSDPRLCTATLESVGRLLAKAALVGVRWESPCQPAVWLDLDPGGSNQPRALLGRFEGITLRQAPQTEAGARTVLALANDLPRAADRRVLLNAFQARMGAVFRAPPNWPTGEA